MKQQSLGFTLIEIMIVVTVIVVLFVGGLFYADNIRASLRDAQRVNDISQIQAALESYYQQHGYYPKDNDIKSGLALTSDDNKITYLEEIPSNPEPRDDGDCDDKDYRYVSLGYEYHLYYCLGKNVGHVTPGLNMAVPGQLACTSTSCGQKVCGKNCTGDCITCESPTPFCLEDGSACVQCLVDADCQQGFPCINNTCVPMMSFSSPFIHFWYFN